MRYGHPLFSILPSSCSSSFAITQQTLSNKAAFLPYPFGEFLRLHIVLHFFEPLKSRRERFAELNFTYWLQSNTGCVWNSHCECLSSTEKPAKCIEWSLITDQFLIWSPVNFTRLSSCNLDKTRVPSWRAGKRNNRKQWSRRFAGVVLKPKVSAVGGCRFSDGKNFSRSRLQQKRYPKASWSLQLLGSKQPEGQSSIGSSPGK